MDNRPPRWRTWLDVATSLTLTVAAALVAWSMLRSPAARSRTIPVPSGPVSFAHAPTKGNSGAPLGLIIYSDFQCPYCARFEEEVVPELNTRYVDTGMMLVAFKHLPLRIHADARLAAEAGACAADQGDFWSFHDRLFGQPDGINAAVVAETLSAAGIDARTFAQCRKRSAAQVDADVAEAQELAITSTPSFLIGIVTPDRALRVRATIRGAQPLGEFIRQIDDLLQGRSNG